MISDSIVWVIALIVFLVAEGVTVSALVSIWFAVGSLFALIASFFTDSWVIEIAICLIVSCIAFALLRPIVKQKFNPKTEETNAQSLIGTIAVVTQRIDNLAASGQVKLRGQTWTARCETDTPIEEGAAVSVIRIEGVKVIVVPSTQSKGE